VHLFNYRISISLGYWRNF